MRITKINPEFRLVKFEEKYRNSLMLSRRENLGQTKWHFKNLEICSKPLLLRKVSYPQKIQTIRLNSGEIIELNQPLSLYNFGDDMQASAQSDIYHYRRGDGLITIDETATGRGNFNNTIQLGSGIEKDDIYFCVTRKHLLIQFYSSRDDQIVVWNFFNVQGSITHPQKVQTIRLNSGETIELNQPLSLYNFGDDMKASAQSDIYHYHREDGLITIDETATRRGNFNNIAKVV